jgi:C-terminal processing protease CtpA/Prc
MGVRYSERALPIHANGGKPTDQDKAAELANMKARNFGVERVELLPGNIGYLDLRNFAPAKAAGDTIGAAMAMLQHTDALIIDLRKNGGGESSGVALLASYLLDERTHISDYYDRATGTTEQSWSVDHLAGPRYGADRPVYILTSGRTFSAAEEFSYDMKAMKRATIVGETSGGGAHPGDVYRLSEHFQMFIPTGRSINPITKADWDGVGVAPDIGVSRDRALPAAESSVLKKLIAAMQDPGRKARLQGRLDEVETGGTDKVSAK